MAEDQTDTQWIEQYGTDAPGTGVFLKLEENKGEFVIIFARNVTYTRCMIIGDDFGYAAFKWVPAKVAAYATVKNSRCASDGDPCVDTCRGFGCICHTERRVCVSASSNGGSAQEAHPAESGTKEMEFA